MKINNNVGMKCRKNENFANNLFSNSNWKFLLDSKWYCTGTFIRFVKEYLLTSSLLLFPYFFFSFVCIDIVVVLLVFTFRLQWHFRYHKYMRPGYKKLKQLLFEFSWPVFKFQVANLLYAVKNAYATTLFKYIYKTNAFINIKI